MTELSFISVCPEEELPPGERLFLEIENKSIVIFNLAGDYYAIEDVCTHDDGPLGEGEVEDHQIICPRHGARFAIRTGAGLTLPAIQDVPAYHVRVVDGMIEIGIKS